MDITVSTIYEYVGNLYAINLLCKKIGELDLLEDDTIYRTAQENLATEMDKYRIEHKETFDKLYKAYGAYISEGMPATGENKGQWVKKIPMFFETDGDMVLMFIERKFDINEALYEIALNQESDFVAYRYYVDNINK